MKQESDSINIVKYTILSILTIILILNINVITVSATINTANEKSRNKIDLFSNIYDIITGTIEGYAVILNEEVLGYISSEVNFEDIKGLIEERYANEGYINNNLILSFDIDGSINLKEERVLLDKINTEEEIAETIYNLSKNDNNEIKLKVKYLKEKDVEVKPSTIIIPTEELYLGESKIIEGEYGLTKQVMEVMSENNNVRSTKVVKENIVKNCVSKIIYRGTKNPYEYGIAFLNQPTRGGDLTSAYGERWNSFHKGIDIAGDTGDDVLVALNGRVTYAEYNNGGYGNLIIVEHDNNMKTYYGHLDDFYVSVGDEVRKGDIIGALGNTGFSTGPHLHFELRVNNNPVDPYDYIIQ